MSVLNRTYSQVMMFGSHIDRLNYLRVVDRDPFEESFGQLRALNQKLYASRAWKEVRDYVVFRDGGCDLAIPGYQIEGKVLVHHMNPLTPHDLATVPEWVFNPEYLITVSHPTHQFIHYGIVPRKAVLDRHAGDTTLWSKLL